MQTTTPATQATTARHTPGPWIWDDNTLRPANPNPDTSSVRSILDAEGGYGFMFSDVNQTWAELDADRVLIAAAPDMLAALQAVAQKLGSRPYGTGSYLPKPIRDVVFSAIAKATGQQGGAA